MTTHACSFQWERFHAKNHRRVCSVLTQPVPNCGMLVWWCLGRRVFCREQMSSLYWHQLCTWNCIVWYFLGFSVPISDTTEYLLTLSFLWLLSVHGLLKLLAPWTLKFVLEQVETIMFSVLEKMVTTLFQERWWCLVSSQASGFTLPKNDPRIDVFSHLMLSPSWKLCLACLCSQMSAV